MINEANHQAVAHPYEAQDYYQVDGLLTEEHLVIRDSVRNWINVNITPIR
ncbi:MAG: hypothetical protein AAFY70_05745 [Bacteroidota bacterium]